MHQRDLGGDVGEIEGFLDRRVAAADHDDFLVAEEKPVAGGAGRHAFSAVFLLALQTQPAGLRAS